MDLTTAGILLLDGATNGAIYALLALALVLAFSVTRVIFIPQGEFVAHGALTMAALQTGKFAPTASLLLAFGILAFLMDLFDAGKQFRLMGHGAGLPRALALAVAKYLLFPVVVYVVVKTVPCAN